MYLSGVVKHWLELGLALGKLTLTITHAVQKNDCRVLSALT